MQLLLSGVFYITFICCKIQRTIQLRTTINIYRTLSKEQFKRLETKIWQKEAAVASPAHADPTAVRGEW